MAFNHKSSLPKKGSGVESKSTACSVKGKKGFRRPEPLKAGRPDLNEIKFDPHSYLLKKSWHSYSKNILCVNAYPNGITVSLHCGSALESNSRGPNVKKAIKPIRFPSQFHLRIKDTRDFRLPAGKYFLYRDSVKQALEKHLSQLHKSNTLGQSVVYFGTVSDPFLSFRKKFDVTMACLELFENYKPGRLVIQTRSPMVISALPVLKNQVDRSVVSIPIETSLENSVRRYTPGQPKISERIVAASGLRRQGVKVNLQVSPILPYGDFYSDAWGFAEMLENHADYLTFGSLAMGHKEEERHLKQLVMSQRLASDKKFHWLRPYSYRNVFKALSVLAPEKLDLPVKRSGQSNQLDLFAA